MEFWCEFNGKTPWILQDFFHGRGPKTAKLSNVWVSAECNEARNEAFRPTCKQWGSISDVWILNTFPVCQWRFGSGHMRTCDIVEQFNLSTGFLQDEQLIWTLLKFGLCWMICWCSSLQMFNLSVWSAHQTYISNDQQLYETSIAYLNVDR